MAPAATSYARNHRCESFVSRNSPMSDPVQPSSSPTLGIAKQIDAEYREALARVAEEHGVPPDELRADLAAAAEDIPLTPDCVTLAEVERYPTVEDLPFDRRRHVKSCALCIELMA